MANFSRSFKPTSYLHSMAARRPPLGGRSMSNSSEKSSSSPSSPSLDPRGSDGYGLSSGRSPVPYLDGQVPPPRSPNPLRPVATSSAQSPSFWPTAASNDSPQLGDTARSTPTRSRPIAIEISGTNRGRTPPPPLSARGDLPGGYFPLHEQESEQANTYRPHPFYLDASKARKRSIQLATRDSSDSTSRASPVTAATDVAVSNVTATGTISVPPPTTAPATMADQPTYLQLPDNVNTRASNRPNMPVTSYNPSGFAHDPLPMGKYYPSNYERWRPDRQGQMGSPGSQRSVSPFRQDTSPRLTSPPAPQHSRHESDAKRRIQQYQRDMVAQATMLMNHGGLNPAAMQSLRNLGISGGSRPSQPRLEPLGSPGPVTPMELGGSGDGYLGVHGSTEYTDEVARVLREEEDRRRAQGSISPAIELGPNTF